MRLALVHVEDMERSGAGEEAYVVIPGGAEKTVLAVPFDALGDFVPLLHEALGELDVQCCDACGEPLAR